jgi:hypothetical protein
MPGCLVTIYALFFIFLTRFLHYNAPVRCKEMVE